LLINNIKGIKSLSAMGINSAPTKSEPPALSSHPVRVLLIIINPVKNSKKITISKKARKIKTMRKISALKYAAAINITAAKIKKTIITEKERFLK